MLCQGGGRVSLCVILGCKCPECVLSEQTITDYIMEQSECNSL